MYNTYTALRTSLPHFTDVKKSVMHSVYCKFFCELGKSTHTNFCLVVNLTPSMGKCLHIQ